MDAAGTSDSDEGYDDEEDGEMESDCDRAEEDKHTS